MYSNSEVGKNVYPFGKEHEVSTFQLFTSYCNNLYLGQWELARSTIHLLRSQRTLLQKDIDEVSRNISENPLGFSLGSAAVPSPDHLAWLSFLDCQQDESERETAASVKKAIEFRLLLLDGCRDAKPDIIKEIFKYFQATVSHKRKRGRGDATSDAPNLSHKCQDFLTDLLKKEPAVGHSLIQSLRVPDSSFERINLTLHNLYLQCLHTLLSEIRNTAEDETQTDSNNGSGIGSDSIVTKFYDVLSLFDPPKNIKGLSFVKFLEDLCCVCNEERSRLRLDSIYSCLMGKSSQFILDEFCEVLSNQTYVLPGSTIGADSVLNKEGRTLIGLCQKFGNVHGNEFAWKDLYLLCLRHQRHFLDMFVETSIMLIQENKFDQLAKLIRPAEFQPLCPLVLVVGWEHCSNIDAAKMLVDTLGSFMSDQGSLLGDLAEKMKYQVNLVHWCLEKSRPTGNDEVSKENRFPVLFQSLEGHSALHLLHHCANLSELDMEEVFNLLRQKVPLGAPGAIEHVKKDMKSVRFADTSDGNNTESELSLSLEQRHDTVIFRAYCALKLVMDVLAFCADSTNWEILGTLKVQKLSANGDSSSAFDCDSQDVTHNNMEAFEKIYKDNVMSKLNSVKECLSKVHPLRFRVELLENIFSVLFLTNEDMHQEADVHSDSGEEGGVDSRALSRTASHGSTNSVSVSQTVEDASHFFTISDDNVMLWSDKTSSTNTGTETVVNTQTQQLRDPLLSTVKTYPRKEMSNPVGSFVLPRVELNDGPSTKLENRRKASGNASVTSGASTSNAKKIGFVVNEYIVRDVLHTLKDCLMELSATKFKLISKSEDSPSEPSAMSSAERKEMECSLNGCVDSDVSDDKMQQRISKLQQCISEASWRFQLASHDWLPTEPGEIVVDLKKVEEAGDYWGDEYESQKRGRRKRKTQHSISREMSQSANESESVFTTDESGISNISQNKAPSNATGPLAGIVGGMLKPKQDIVPRMLAPKHSLLNMCLRRGKYSQAEQVVKMFSLEREPEAAEVIFAEQYQSAVKKLQSLDSKPSEKMNVSGTKSKLKQGSIKPSLSAIASVAAAGVASVSATSTVDQVLSLSALPSLSTSVLEELQQSSTPLASYVQVSSIPAMIVLDLVCVASRSWDASASLLDMAKTRFMGPALPSGKQDRQQASSHTAQQMGIEKLLTQLTNLIKLGSSEGNPEMVEKYTRKSIGQALICGGFPIQADALKMHATLLVELEKNIRRAEKAQEDAKRWETHNLLQSVNNQTEGSSSLISTTHEKPVVRIAMKHLIATMKKYCPSEGILTSLLKGVVDASSHKLNYLQSLYDHVKTLSCLVEDCLEKPKELTTMEYFKMLDESPTQILGKLIFVNNFSPVRLESVAEKLHVKLMQIIVNSCCPTVPVSTSSGSFTGTNTTAYLDQGQVILNHSLKRPSLINRHPEVAVREMLTKLIQLMKDFADLNNSAGLFTYDVAMSLVSDTSFQDIQQETRELGYLDLKLLSLREELLCFYGNLINLFTVHALLYYISCRHPKAPTSSERKLSRQLSRSISVTSINSDASMPHVNLSFLLPSTECDWIILQNQVAYSVGQLGVVSLFDLKYLVVRSGLPAPCCGNGLVEARWHELTPLDPWKRYGPPPEPRLTFVLTEGHMSSPPLQVLSPDMVVAQLRIAMKEYLFQSVYTSEESNTIYLPQLLLWYKNDFAGESKMADLQHEALVNFVASQVSDKLASQLRNLISQHALHTNGDKKAAAVNVHIVSHVMEFAFTFDFEQFESIEQLAAQRQRRRSSLPPRIQSSCENSKTSARDHTRYITQASQMDQVSFTLTGATLDYLKSKSELVAVLATLVGKEPVDESDLSNGDQANTCSEEQMEIRKFRHRILSTDFAEMCRHMQLHVLPMEQCTNQVLTVCEDRVKALMMSALSECSRSCLLLSPQHQQYYIMVQGVIRYLLDQRKWDQLLNMLNDIPESTIQSHCDLVVLRDFVLCCLAQSQGIDHNTDNVEGWQYLLQIRDPATKIRVVLGSLMQWPVDVCRYLLQNSLNGKIPNSQLRKAAQSKLEEIEVHEKITQCAKTLQVQGHNHISQSDLNDFGSDELNHDMLESLTKWTVVQRHSREQPELVLTVLLKCHEYECARQWARIHKANRLLLQIIEERNVAFLLEKDNPEFISAFQALENIQERNSSLCIDLCSRLLTNLENKANTLFIVQYLLQQLASKIEPERIERLKLLRLGCMSLLCLPQSARGDYEHLIAHPNLLFEQLLMNMKVEWAGLVVNMLVVEWKKVVNKDLGFDQKTCDALISKYSSKALEFPVLQYEDIGKMTRIASCSSIASAASGVSRLARPPSSSSLSAFHSPTPRRFSRNVSYSHLAALNSPGSFGRMRPTADSLPSSSSIRRKSTPAQPLASSPTPGGQQSESSEVASQFAIPPEPPSKDQWVPDYEAEVCMVCRVTRFSMFNRRHHCRRCGRVVCAPCSMRTTLIRGTSARTCDQCYDHTFKPKGVVEERRIQKLRDKLSGASEGSRSPSVIRSLSAECDDDITLSVQLQSDYQYILAEDEELNEATREEFYFDQAPSTSLCLSILGLHSKPKECGQLILNLCDDVSKFLQPIAPGIRNPEVDYSFVISMLRYLLFNAKIKFLSVMDNTGVEECDLCIGRVDLLNLLVVANCAYIPSMQQLTKLDSLRGLRDKLIEDERLELAMNISTKCGIDPSAVWSAWGMAKLKTGNYLAAREKFSKCLKTPSDQTQVQPKTKLLGDIIEFLQSAVESKGTNAESLLLPLKSQKDLLAEPPQMLTDESVLEKSTMKECLYYLSTYGTHMNMITFYIRHNCLKKAVQFIIEKKATSDVFVEAVFLPCLRAGKMEQLQTQMTLIDPSLEIWNPFLTATCRNLNKNQHINTLYQMQLYMKDFIRAAMTCITYFYQKGAMGYADLFQRIQHLLDAKQHLETFLEHRQWGTAPRGGAQMRSGWPSSSSSTRMGMTPGEVNKYINTINLQIDVTKFLYRYLENLNTVQETMSPATTPSSSPFGAERFQPHLAPPTLFNNTKVKAEVVNMLLLSGNNVNDGFGLAFRIIQDFKLDSSFIYTQAAHYFAKLHKYNSIRQLIGCIKDSGLSTVQSFDEVLGASIRVIAGEPSESKEAENLIKMIKSDENKINAYVLCGKLKSAYLIAVRAERVDDVKRISAAADRAGQTAVKNICDKWLQMRQSKH